jgi:hypothetical protein
MALFILYAIRKNDTAIGYRALRVSKYVSMIAVEESNKNDRKGVG